MAKTKKYIDLVEKIKDRPEWNKCVQKGYTCPRSEGHAKMLNILINLSSDIRLTEKERIAVCGGISWENELTAMQL